MPKVTYITPDGEKFVVEKPEDNLMTTALENDIPGVDGDCGGVCSCGTCHVHIAREWMEKVGPASEDEKDMLEWEDDADETSRLGCQVQLTPELDGLVVHVAKR